MVFCRNYKAFMISQPRRRRIHSGASCLRPSKQRGIREIRGFDLKRRHSHPFSGNRAVSSSTFPGFKAREIKGNHDEAVKGSFVESSKPRCGSETIKCLTPRDRRRHRTSLHVVSPARSRFPIKLSSTPNFKSGFRSLKNPQRKTRLGL